MKIKDISDLLEYEQQKYNCKKCLCEIGYNYIELRDYAILILNMELNYISQENNTIIDTDLDDIVDFVIKKLYYDVTMEKVLASINVEDDLKKYDMMDGYKELCEEACCDLQGEQALWLEHRILIEQKLLDDLRYILRKKKVKIVNEDGVEEL
jgi:hypothetical protein